MVVNDRSGNGGQSRRVVGRLYIHAFNQAVVLTGYGGIDRTAYLDGSVDKAGHILHPVQEAVIAQERATAQVQGAEQVIT